MRSWIFILLSIWPLSGFATNPTIQSVFADPFGFFIVTVENGEVPYYCGSFMMNKLFPIYSNKDVLGGQSSYASDERNFLRTDQAFLEVSSAGHLVSGTLTQSAQTRVINGKKETIGGKVTLESRNRHHEFFFQGELTLRFREQLGKSIFLVPHESPTEIFLPVDGGTWKPGHVFIIDRELLPLQAALYQAWMHDGQSLNLVGSSNYPEVQAAMSIPLHSGGELIFFGREESAIYRSDADASIEARLDYIPTTDFLIKRIGYQSKPFSSSPISCIGMLLRQF